MRAAILGWGAVRGKHMQGDQAQPMGKVKITEGAGGEDSKEMKKGELMEVIFFAVLLLHL